MYIVHIIIYIYNIRILSVCCSIIPMVSNGHNIWQKWTPRISPPRFRLGSSLGGFVCLAAGVGRTKWAMASQSFKMVAKSMQRNLRWHRWLGKWQKCHWKSLGISTETWEIHMGIVGNPWKFPDHCDWTIPAKYGGNPVQKSPLNILNPFWDRGLYQAASLSLTWFFNEGYPA